MKLNETQKYICIISVDMALKLSHSVFNYSHNLDTKHFTNSGNITNLFFMAVDYRAYIKDNKHYC